MLWRNRSANGQPLRSDRNFTFGGAIRPLRVAPSDSEKPKEPKQWFTDQFWRSTIATTLIVIVAVLVWDATLVVKYRQPTMSSAFRERALGLRIGVLAIGGLQFYWVAIMADSSRFRKTRIAMSTLFLFLAIHVYLPQVIATHWDPLDRFFDQVLHPAIDSFTQ